MSMMGSDEETPRPGDRLNEALVEFTGCVGTSLEGICSYGLTIGETYVPFDPDPEDDCDEDEAACSQVWVRVTEAGPGNLPESWGGDTCALEMVIGLEVGVLRCIEIHGRGEAPTASEVLAAATQAVEDMNRLLCAALGCEVWEVINVGQWSPMGPLGGQYGGTWTFTVEV